MVSTVSVDDPRDAMSKRLEDAVRDLLLLPGTTPDDPLLELVAAFRGEPYRVPVKLYPFVAVVIARGPLSAQGRGDDRNVRDDTGPTRYLVYDGYVKAEVLHKDASALVPTLDKRIDVPSHDQAWAMAMAAHNRFALWGTDFGVIDGPNAVVSQDGKERSQFYDLDEIVGALTQRVDNVSNSAMFEFHITTKREDYA